MTSARYGIGQHDCGTAASLFGNTDADSAENALNKVDCNILRSDTKTKHKLFITSLILWPSCSANALHDPGKCALR